MSEGAKPTTLSGKQVSNVRIAVFAMFAAIVMQSVPFGHILLCLKPSSEYVCEYAVRYFLAFAMSPV